MPQAVAASARHARRAPVSFRVGKALLRRDVRGAWRWMQLLDRLGLLQRSCEATLLGSALRVPLDWRWFWQHEQVSEYEPVSLRHFAARVRQRANGPAVLLDCGAHIGVVSHYLAHACAPLIKQVVCFEPDPQWRAVLQANLQALPVPARLVPQGAGAFSGAATLLRPPDGADDGGYLVPDPKGQARVMRIDDLALPAEHGLVLKIDVEGGELDVLRGAEQRLREAPFVVVMFEAHRAVAQRCGVDPVEVLRYLCSIRPFEAVLSSDAAAPVTTARSFFEQHPLREKQDVLVWSL